VVTLPPVGVTVHRFDLLDRDGARLRLRVDCSSGTYIRSLARDLGEALGTGAHLTELRRRSVGRFDVDEAVAVDALDRVPAEAWIRPSDALARAGVPLIEVDADARGLLAQGRTVPCAALGPASGAEAVGAVHEGELLAVGEAADGRFQPRRVFVTA
jgi:tRNA pseudouridine55 synthase